MTPTLRWKAEEVGEPSIPIWTAELTSDEDESDVWEDTFGSLELTKSLSLTTLQNKK